MNKLILLRGLPGSGKSTYAKELVAQNKNQYIRVNRDTLRAMLFDSKWSRENEQDTVNAEKAIAFDALINGKVVIVDDTNLTSKHIQLWSDLVSDVNLATLGDRVFTMEVKDFFDVPLDVCVRHDESRAYSEIVGQAVIHKMALRTGLIKWLDQPIAIFDIDGTLSNPADRLHYVTSGNKDWHNFFDECYLDRPNWPVIDWCNRCYTSDMTVVIVSGRPTDKCQLDTLSWLKQYHVKYNYIFMRDGGDHRPDTEIKQQILNWMPKERIEFVVDDRHSVIKMWLDNGLKVYPVTSNEEF